MNSLIPVRQAFRKLAPALERPAEGLVEQNIEAARADIDALLVHLRQAADEPNMAEIGFLGAGAMGTRTTAWLMEDGRSLRIWNRTAEWAQAVIDLGTKLVHSPCEAAKNADFVVSMVRYDDASQRVWMDQNDGAVAIECSTLSMSEIRMLHDHCDGAGHPLLDAPVAGSRPKAEQRQHDVHVERGLEILGSPSVSSPSAKGAAASMIAISFAPMFPVELVVKDFGYVLDAATINRRAPS